MISTCDFPVPASRTVTARWAAAVSSGRTPCTNVSVSCTACLKTAGLVVSAAACAGKPNASATDSDPTAIIRASPRVMTAFERLMGLILTAIAVEMLLAGVRGYVRSL